MSRFRGAGGIISYNVHIYVCCSQMLFVAYYTDRQRSSTRQLDALSNISRRRVADTLIVD